MRTRLVRSGLLLGLVGLPPAGGLDLVVPHEPLGGLQLGLEVDGAELFEQGPTAPGDHTPRYHLSGRVTGDRVRLRLVTSPMTARLDDFGRPVYSTMKATAWWDRQPPLTQVADPFDGGRAVTGFHAEPPATLEFDLPLEGQGPGGMIVELRKVNPHGTDWHLQLRVSLHRDAPARVHLTRGQAIRTSPGRVRWANFGTGYGAVLRLDPTGPDTFGQEILPGEVTHLFAGDQFSTMPGAEALIDHPAGYRMLVGEQTVLHLDGRTIYVEYGQGVLVENVGGPGEFEVRTKFSRANVNARRFVIHSRGRGGGNDFSLSLEDGTAQTENGAPPRTPEPLTAGQVLVARFDNGFKLAREALAADDRALFVELPPLPDHGPGPRRPRCSTALRGELRSPRVDPECRPHHLLLTSNSGRPMLRGVGARRFGVGAADVDVARGEVAWFVHGGFRGACGSAFCRWSCSARAATAGPTRCRGTG